MTIALVTADADTLVADPDVDMPVLIEALSDVGVSAEAIDWRSETDWSRFDLVVLRSPWNYSDHYRQFLDWLAHVDQQSHLLNPIDLLRWNLDKRYLADLHSYGVPTVPTAFARTLPEVRSATAEVQTSRLVIKPAVSAGSKDTGLYDVNDEAALSLAARIIDSGRTVMVQPEIESVSTKGEKALIFFAGEFSHAVSKGPLLNPGGGLLGGFYQEVIAASAATDEELDVGRAALDVASEQTSHSVPLYARIDIADDNGQPRVLEAELLEPSCFLSYDAESPRRFAEAIRVRCQSPR